MTRKVLFVAAFGTLYTICTAVGAASALGAAVSGLDGTTPASDATVHFLGVLADGLMLPLVPLFAPRGFWAYALICGNGVIWGSALVALWSLVRRHRTRHESSRAAA